MAKNWKTIGIEDEVFYTRKTKVKKKGHARKERQAKRDRKYGWSEK